ncbi:RNA polymerase subunit sigma-70 [Amycolatopsis antarctica]|uniref:RNA polymerase subunit sigma-70 n=1 Tax=Amycolatopsis antarctica TaxID=1854586 RepID=A0A263D2Q9_9PSEU|nr:RNA polymerase subunit sigma-70 [Amycolatopsis antarctica]OZM71766.1 RNA polymerase subunit sigma-70 [Amycolatopsis antarctica]
MTELRLERYRAELTAYCYRMLGSGFEAEDAAQECLVRAWRNAGAYDAAKAAPRTWLYAIATNVCFDMLRSAQRRARAMDLVPAAGPGTPLGAPLPEPHWVQPVPDGRLFDEGDPADQVVLRESVRLAFVAALQVLPPRQRAVLILREVLRWRAGEVAELLGDSVASVNSALQRARAGMADHDTAAAPAPLDAHGSALLSRYVDAFERHDVGVLVALLHEDATMSMPPFTWWLRGRADIGAAISAPGQSCEGDRLVPAGFANGVPAFGQYRDGEGFAWVLIEVTAEHVTEVTTCLDPARLFPFFGLPMSFAGRARTTIDSSRTNTEESHGRRAADRAPS